MMAIDHPQRTRFGWLMRLVAWDGIVPWMIWCFPFLIRWVFPGWRGAVELSAIILPVLGLLIRLVIGVQAIQINYCSPTWRAAQRVALIIGLLVLGLIDGVMIISHLLPQGFPIATWNDRIVWICLGVVYLSAMLFAWYPGRAPVIHAARQGS